MSRRAKAALVVAWATATATSVVASHVAVDQSRDDLEAVAVAYAQQTREASLSGCERTKADRREAILGWETARDTRRETAGNRRVPARERTSAAAAAAVYDVVVKGYRSRLVDCSAAFPPVNPAIVRRALERGR